MDYRINAYEAKKLVEASKIENIYDKIRNRAREGHLTANVPYIGKDALYTLLEDGFSIYSDTGTIELTQYDPEVEEHAKEYEISWEG